MDENTFILIWFLAKYITNIFIANSLYKVYFIKYSTSEKIDNILCKVEVLRSNIEGKKILVNKYINFMF